MRIISGKYKGRRFDPPRNLDARPTTDFAKTGLFNYLMSRIEPEEITVLDLFSGSGNIAYEFASRGFKHITAVDVDPKAIKYIQDNILRWNIDNIHVIKDDVIRFLSMSHQQFDIIFADPPFAWEQKNELIDIIFSRNILRENGLFILEHGKNDAFNSHPQWIETRKYGHVFFSYFQHINNKK